MLFDVRVDIKTVQDALGALGKEIVPTATVSALNRVATTTRAVARRNISQETGIKSGAINKFLRLRRASRAQPEARVIALSHAPNLINYNAYQTKAGVSANAWRKRKVYKGTFIGNRGRTVFKRIDYRPASGAKRTIGRHDRRGHTRTRGGVGFNVRPHSVGSGQRKPRSRIKAVYGPSVRKTFLQRRTDEAMRQTIRERWPLEFNREVQFRINRRFGRT